MIALWLSKVLAKSFRILLAVTLVSTTFAAIASAEQPGSSNEPELLQTEITQQDLKIIEQLVAIAERNSAEVLETKAAMGLNAFTDVVALEFSPSVATISTSPDDSSERENSFSFTITIDPIKFISTFGQLPVLQARWKQARQQKRLAIVQYYVAYIQARQAALVAAYRMQKFTRGSRIASISSRTTSRENNHLANPDYVAAATSMLDTNTRKRLALEELAACVGISVQELSAMIDK
ncbi:hypothetical protein PCC6912_23660 [Chlorogloeopsis fritschii PCC 6912]|uniref:Uncharacterized protein n=1 Tax=Chlorogloeopsis fritschii PCC 6912 TaxID=211165 RepID=A0A3S0Y2L4_CHLFR|nr:hypothetical protein [Chlorogloeopsis fritschii]RUR82992.1 hypothetical protein PCC6912_23660 [Chlorogloeopsis fritschii PCC 6912]